MVVFSRKLLLLLGLGIVVGFGPRLAHAQIPPGYEVIRITEEAGSYQPPAINARGQVVFSQRIDNDFDLEEIFLWTPDPDGEGGAFTQITDDNVRDAFPDINDNGTIVWSRAKAPGQSSNLDIVMLRDGQMVQITDDEIRDSVSRVNNLDHVAWYHTMGPACGGSADVFFYDGETTTQITDDGFWNQWAVPNDRDEIVWTRYNFCVNPWQSEMMLYSGGKTTQLTAGGAQIQIPDINNDTTVVWGGEFGIERWADGEREVLIAPGNNPSLNNAGFISFSRQLEQDDFPQAWWFDGEDFLRLTNGPGWNAALVINAFGETAWLSGPRVGSFDVVMMRRMGDPADLNLDGNVDLADFVVLQVCFDPGRTPSEVCRPADLDRNNSVDLEDSRLLVMRLIGPG